MWQKSRFYRSTVVVVGTFSESPDQMEVYNLQPEAGFFGGGRRWRAMLGANCGGSVMSSHLWSLDKKKHQINSG